MATIADWRTVTRRDIPPHRMDRLAHDRYGLTGRELDALLDPDTCRARQAVTGDIGPCDPGARIILAAWARGTEAGTEAGMDHLAPGARPIEVTSGCARHIAVHAAARVGVDVELTSLSL